MAPTPFSQVDLLVAPSPMAAALAATGPSELARLRHSIARGLPSVIPLDNELQLVLTLPTGQVRPWLALSVDQVVSRSAEESAPHPASAASPPQEVVARPPLSLVLVRRNRPVAAAPLVLGSRRLLPNSGGAPAVIELLVLGWEVRAGSLRGPGDVGSWIELAWRRVDRGTSTFAPPPIPVGVAQRVAAALAAEGAGDSP